MASTSQWPDVVTLPIDKPPTTAPHKLESEIPSDDDMRFNDPENILYVNLTGPDVAKFKDRIDELQEMLQLTHQLATIHAGIQVMRRKAEGKLPTDDSQESGQRRSECRFRVLDTYSKDDVYTWMYSPQSTQVSKVVNIKKSKFHWKILADMLEGMVIPRPLAATIEKIFKSVGDTINETEYTRDGHNFWSMLQVYTYDKNRDELRASLRNITYSLSQDMYMVTKNKSSMTTINDNWDFGITNFSFNETTWKTVKSAVSKYIDDTGIHNIENPPSVPV
ncbi:mitochondrial chaperone DnaJ homeolog p [Epichloe bromicola]|uniref:Mitochondrial chaperone DnaJ homeolog p n=1 Tax=Epichloe bromicola TaxID=79588 RepID=A0ABQ0CI55_9HYPO